MLPCKEMAQAQRRATYEDILALPEHVVGQVVDGDLHVHPRPASPHARAASVLGADLGSPFDRGRGGPGGWLILLEPELHLGPDILVPDLAGWRREHMPEMPRSAFFTLAPDWTCEVLSPGTAKIDRGPKRRAYAREGVAYLWFVDPDERTLEAFRLDGESYLLLATFEDDARGHIPPFEAIELEVGALWSR